MRYLVQLLFNGETIVEEEFPSKRKARICIRKLAGRMLPGEIIKFVDTQEGAPE